MKIKLFGITISTGKDVEPVRSVKAELTDKALADIQKGVEALLLERSENPSSKEGREIYWANVSVLWFPFALIGSAFDFVSGSEVWYSKRGTRHVFATWREL